MSYRFETVLTLAVAVVAFLFGTFFLVPPLLPNNNTGTPDTNNTVDNPNTAGDTDTGDGTNTANGTDTAGGTDTINGTNAQIQNGIANYINDFMVTITPWTPSSNPDIGERVQVSVTNTSNETYNYVLLHIVFTDDFYSPIKTTTAGVYSQIDPSDTVSVYISANGIAESTAFVYAVEDDYFILDDERGLMSTR
ncbi:MAG: hypothetical protein LBQ05_00270 [Christensenellaceae bacterium]|jgi:hypothetical protein|nr:hypothetical protein [Christensenellaceae bacterium]